MDSAKLNDWLQVVGLFGVIASLLFVGLQMKQEQEIARSAASQARAATTIQHLSEMSSNDIYMGAINKLAAGEPLLPSEQASMIMNDRATWFIFENIHYQFLSGFVEEERWQGVRTNIKYSLGTRPSFRAIYESSPSAWRKSFRDVVDELIVQVDSEGGSE